jgi:hypothetical protein
MSNPYRTMIARLAAALQQQVFRDPEMDGNDLPCQARALLAQPEPEEADIHYAWELHDAEGDWQAGGTANSLEDVQREGNHYLQIYSQDGPHTLIIQRVSIIEEVPLLDQPEPPELTNEDLISAHDLAAGWNQQADADDQWDSLDLYEQLDWAQSRAIAADRARYGRPTPQPEPPDADAQQLQQIAHAASDYLCGKQFPSFAEEHGGLDLLEAQLARLLAHFEHGSRPVRALLLMRARVSHQSSLSHQAGD